MSARMNGAEMIIEFPNSPGIPVLVERGGSDPITGEPMTEQRVVFSWRNADGGREERTFMGPE